MCVSVCGCFSRFLSFDSLVTSISLTIVSFCNVSLHHLVFCIEKFMNNTFFSLRSSSSLFGILYFALCLLVLFNIRSVRCSFSPFLCLCGGYYCCFCCCVSSTLFSIQFTCTFVILHLIRKCSVLKMVARKHSWRLDIIKLPKPTCIYNDMMKH